MMHYISSNGTHAVFTSQVGDEAGYEPGGFDVVKLETGDYAEGRYPRGNFIGHRMRLEAATIWAERCAQQAPERMVPFRFSAKRESSDSIRLDGWNEDGSGEGPTIALTNSSALGLVREVVTALDSEVAR